MPDDKEIEEAEKKVEKLLERLSSSIEIVSENHETFKSWVPPDFVIPGLTKDYVEAVKRSNGLTSTLPSVTSKIQKAAKENPTVKELEEAIKALKAHREKVGNQEGANPNDVEAFQEAVDEIISCLEEAIGE